MLKRGQIGLAHDHGKYKMECVRKYPEIFEVVGVAEENDDNVKQFGNQDCYKGLPFMTVDELLNVKGLDAIMVETEELHLVKAAQMCVDVGIHVHIDKPGGTNIAEFERLLDTAKAKKLSVQMAYMYRYNPTVQYCKQAVDDGVLGEIYQVDAIMNTCISSEKREWMKDFPGGNMFYLGCHMVDLVLMMMGTPDRIIPLNKCTGFDGVTAKDHGFAVFEYPNGVSTVRAAATDVNGFGRRQLVVCGSKGTIEIKPFECYKNIPEGDLYLSTLDMVRNNNYADCKCKIPLPPQAGRYDAMMLDFAAMVRGEKENPFTYEYELAVQKAVLAACGGAK